MRLNEKQWGIIALLGIPLIVPFIVTVYIIILCRLIECAALSYQAMMGAFMG